MWGHELEWLSILLRWLHVIIGVMWLGASFYIISWENKFNRLKDLPKGIEGNFWTIQGGDFYYVEKLEKAPSQLPDELHWFKYEAYLTWLSGFFLLCVVFYVNAETMLIDSRVADISPAQGISIGLGTLLLSWLAYNLFCKTPWAKNFELCAVLGLVFLALISYFFSLVFSQHAAIIHVGAVLGTIMSGNVFFVIIPWHKALLKAIEKKQPLDLLYRRRPGFRSRHNHYMTLPVFFIMLSGHFQIAFNQSAYWAVITGIALAAGLIKHYHNLYQQQVSAWLYLLAGLGVLASIIAVTAPAKELDKKCKEPVSNEQIMNLSQIHCRACHSATPVDDSWQSPPNGVMFDSIEQLEEHKPKIMQRAAVQQDMPLGNKTNLKLSERQFFKCWATQSG